MKIETIFRHISNSPFLSRYAEEKIIRGIFEKFDGFSDARVVFSKEGDQFAVRCCLYRDGGAVLTMYELKDHAYTAIDGVVEKLAKSISRSQEKKWGKAKQPKPKPSIQYSGVG